MKCAIILGQNLLAEFLLGEIESCESIGEFLVVKSVGEEFSVCLKPEKLLPERNIPELKLNSDMQVGDDKFRPVEYNFILVFRSSVSSPGYSQLCKHERQACCSNFRRPSYKNS